MKTNIYILIVFLFSVSIASAQNTSKVNNEDTIVKVSEVSREVVTSNKKVTNNSNMVELIDSSEVKEAIAQSTSDIRKYYNKIRNVDNLSLLFPKINKVIKA
ncbi:hypothetical protein [Aestuariibaculum sediminum]|uniref:Uncharacterized protein n=1 Tax=Aestuariibaculum sediminum TaxID=2770637 RepID=A0A8J6Q2U4_9FLAO|nr:hypothetical protein [Aestuariibaculum sediminum]MBD0832045.1 hypothetical protein [Aestuariibaculum sediminum]